MNSNNENSWTTEKYTRFEMHPDGRFYTVQEVRTPINPVPVMEDLVDHMGILVPLLEENTAFFLKDIKRLVIQIIRTLPFRATVQVDGNSITSKKDEKIKYKVDFIGNTGVEIDPPFTYAPPDSQRLVFLINPDAYTMHLIAQDKDSGRLYHPNLPNIYEDGRICPGGIDEVVAPYSIHEGLSGFLHRYYTAWSKSKWNSDLLSCGADIERWLRFDEKTKQNIIPTEPVWTDWFRLISPEPLITEALGRLDDVLKTEGYQI